MKKLSVFLGFIFTVCFVFAQHPATIDSFALQTLGNTNTLVKSKGAIGADSGFVNTHFADTTAANRSKISHYPGAQIAVGDLIWIRNITADRWALNTGASITALFYDSTSLNFDGTKYVYYSGVTPVDSVSIYAATNLATTNLIQTGAFRTYNTNNQTLFFQNVGHYNLSSGLNSIDFSSGGILLNHAGAVTLLSNAIRIPTLTQDNALTKILVQDGTVNGRLFWRDVSTIAGAETDPLSWHLTGNAGTTAGTNFLGTTDDISLMFKVNGIKAGYIGNTLDNNTGFGLHSLENNSGDFNSAFGFNALWHNTSGGYNTAFGWGSLRTIATASGNTAYGFQSMASTTTGSNNVGVGYNALYSNQGGSNNTAVGLFSMNGGTSGDNNTAVGNSALNNNLGSNNTAIGYQSATGAVTGTDNIAIGALSKFGSDGFYNIGIGSQALLYQTTGSYNNAIGRNALINSNTSNNTIAIGTQAGQYYGAGSSSLLQADYSTFIGWQPRPAADAQTHQIVIGAYQAVGLGNHSVTIGESSNLVTGIYGTLSLGTVTATPAASAAVDISTTTKGFLGPRMTTTQRDAISSPATGLEIYNTTLNEKQYYTGTVWIGVPLMSSSLSLLNSLGAPTVGETNFSVDRVTTTLSLATQVVRLQAIHVPVSATITGARFFVVTTGVYTPNNYNGVGLFSYSAGTYTLLASSTNDGTIWSAPANAAWASKAFSAPYAAAAGDYFIGALYCSSAQTTAPSLGGAVIAVSSAVLAGLFTNSAKLSGTVPTQTSFAATYAASAVSQTTGQFYMNVY